MSMTAEETQFDRTTTLQRHGHDLRSFEVSLDDSWASLRGVHGGYVSALAVRAVEAVMPDRAVRTVNSTFLRPSAIGSARLDVDVLRHGRSMSTAVVNITQLERTIATVRVTSIAPVAGHDWSVPSSDRPASIDRAVLFTPPPPILHFRQAQLLLDPDTVPMSDGSRPRVAGHVRPNESRPIDAAWLTMIGDWFPPSPFRRFEPPIGGVSIDYSVHIHRLPTLAEGEWLEGVFEAANSADGIALERGVLTTADGVAVAETFHTRWTG